MRYFPPRWLGWSLLAPGPDQDCPTAHCWPRSTLGIGHLPSPHLTSLSLSGPGQALLVTSEASGPVIWVICNNSGLIRDTHDIRPIRGLLWVSWPMRGLVVTRDGGQRLIVWLQRLSRVMTGCAWVMTNKWSCQGVSSSILRVTVTSCVCCLMLSCSQLRGNGGKQGIHIRHLTISQCSGEDNVPGVWPRLVPGSWDYIAIVITSVCLSRTLITDNNKALDNNEDNMTRY